MNYFLLCLHILFHILETKGLDIFFVLLEEKNFAVIYKMNVTQGFLFCGICQMM
jgi:hypothetical protein